MRAPVHAAANRLPHAGRNEVKRNGDR